jgi:hypothetical protein
MNHSKDDKAKTILAGFKGGYSRSKLKPLSELIWKLHVSKVPLRKIAGILDEQYSLKAEASTILRFIKRMEQERSKPRKTRARKEKAPQAVATVPPPVVTNLTLNNTPSDFEAGRQRAAEVRRQKTPPKLDENPFKYDPTQPL